MKRKGRLLLIGIGACVIGAMLIAFFLGLRTETRVSQYSKLLAKWTPSGLVAHFPRVIPASATNARLSAFPGFLQGGAWFQVRFTLPELEIVSVHEEATKRAKAHYDGGSFFELTNSEEKGPPGTTFHTADFTDPDGFAIFPADYRVFIFDARSSGGDHWNHGRSHGVVVSKERNEVIYYAESW